MRIFALTGYSACEFFRKHSYSLDEVWASRKEEENRRNKKRAASLAVKSKLGLLRKLTFEELPLPTPHPDVITATKTAEDYIRKDYAEILKKYYANDNS
ncbi:MAG: hypothetical protein V3V96_15565 [Acidiferrobacterales bacterium]